VVRAGLGVSRGIGAFRASVVYPDYRVLKDSPEWSDHQDRQVLLLVRRHVPPVIPPKPPKQQQDPQQQDPPVKPNPPVQEPPVAPVPPQEQGPQGGGSCHAKHGSC
jgi:hypothetical protein